MKKPLFHKSGNLPTQTSVKSNRVTSRIKHRNLTAKKEAPLELVQKLLDNSSSGFILVDSSFSIQIINKQSAALLRQITGTDYTTGTNFVKIFPDGIAEKVNENLRLALKGEHIDSTLKTDITSGALWFSAHYSPLIESDGSISGIVIALNNITALKQAEERIKNAENKLLTMLSNTQEGFFLINPDFSISLVNDAGCRDIKRITGIDCRAGMHYTDFIMLDNKRKFHEIFQLVMKGNHYEEETNIKTVEGEWLWFYSSYFPVRDEKGDIVAVCCTSKDITERKLVDRALLRIREEKDEYQFRLQSILDNTPLIIFIKDLNGKYLLINRSFREFLRLEETQVVGKTDFDFEKPEIAHQYKEADELVVRTLKDAVLEETVEKPDGLHNLMIVKFPLFDKDNKIYGIGGIATDITDKVQQQQKLIEAKKKAEAAEQLQEQFLANMSHEIRTPMNGIIGMTNVLMNTQLTPEQDEFVQIIRQSSDNLLKLINDILDISKIKAGKLSVEKIDFNLQEMLDNTLAAFKVKARGKNIRLSVMYDRSLPDQVVSDPLRLTQIMVNLLSNAFKFTEEGSIEINVKLIGKDKDKVSIYFGITDTGIGIPDDKLNHIFESFEQAAEETTRKYGGTGLGLSITKKLVNMLGGDIEVKSELNKGTTFSFVLEMSIGKTVSHEVKKAGNEMPADKSLAGKTILVAEDNEVNQKVIIHILKRAGIQTILANNGKEAVTLLEEGLKADLIILDLQMPVMNGFQTSAYIRQKLKLNTPIIAMTASALRNEKMKCFELGMNEYLTKPFAPADLFKHLRRFLLDEQPSHSSEDKTEKSQQKEELYNLSHLTEMEDDEYFCDVLQLFLDTAPVILEQLKEGKIHEDWDLVYKQAHKLKSSLGILQMNSLLSLATSIETSAKNRQETEKIKKELKLLTEKFELIRPMIEAELASVKLKTV
ncbi:MAG TPA: PAS domain-containing protein [Chitinophagaceae bacterium]|nr:PAS domain-containing protein [Chitinophagaceae bacterium]